MGNSENKNKSNVEKRILSLTSEQWEILRNIKNIKIPKDEYDFCKAMNNTKNMSQLLDLRNLTQLSYGKRILAMHLLMRSLGLSFMKTEGDNYNIIILQDFERLEFSKSIDKVLAKQETVVPEEV